MKKMDKEIFSFLSQKQSKSSGISPCPVCGYQVDHWKKQNLLKWSWFKPQSCHFFLSQVYFVKVSVCALWLNTWSLSLKIALLMTCKWCQFANNCMFNGTPWSKKTFACINIHVLASMWIWIQIIQKSGLHWKPIHLLLLIGNFSSWLWPCLIWKFSGKQLYFSNVGKRWRFCWRFTWWTFQF